MAFIKEAINLAKKSSLGWKHGAIVVKDGKIIGRGTNYGYTSPLRGHHSLHAEVDAIFNAVRNIKNKKKIIGAELYVVNWYKYTNNKTEILRCSKPCNNCKRVIEMYGISKVYYSTGDLTNKVFY